MSVDLAVARNLELLGGLLPSAGLDELSSASASLGASAPELSAARARPTRIHTVKARHSSRLFAHGLVGVRAGISLRASNSVLDGYRQILN